MRIIHHQIGRDPLYRVWNSCDECMILYVYSSGGSIVFQDKIYSMEQGTICFIHPQKQHYTMPANPSVYNRSKIYISEEKVGSILKLSKEDKAFCDLFTKNSVVFAQIPLKYQSDVESIYHQAQKSLQDTVSPADFIQQFFRLMVYLKQFATEHIAAPADALTKSVEYINHNYHLPITLDDICDEIHMSKYHFCRKFKDAVGISVMQYLLNTRIAAAKNDLAANRMSINEISEKCGFSSLSYFCQIFKKYTNMTPSEYRKNALQ